MTAVEITTATAAMTTASFASESSTSNDTYPARYMSAQILSSARSLSARLGSGNASRNRPDTPNHPLEATVCLFVNVPPVCRMSSSTSIPEILTCFAGVFRSQNACLCRVSRLEAFFFGTAKSANGLVFKRLPYHRDSTPLLTVVLSDSPENRSIARCAAVANTRPVGATPLERPGAAACVANAAGRPTVYT
eukprot:GHVT01072927.1.p1 GENE.GHVT01072927.1~~GHVT01072927.1.p1  ORF type:complete len:192 (-),score=14.39 GHVT01072927.1:629-1204(-)